MNGLESFAICGMREMERVVGESGVKMWGVEAPRLSGTPSRGGRGSGLEEDSGIVGMVVRLACAMVARWLSPSWRGWPEAGGAPRNTYPQYCYF